MRLLVAALVGKFGEGLSAAARVDGYGGEQVDNGTEAEAYASYIAGHVEEIGGGLTFSELREPQVAAQDELAAAVEADAPDSEIAELQANLDEINGQRDTVFQGEVLRGTLLSTGSNLEKQRVTLHTARGFASPALQGSWFDNGFHGTMAELLLAIEQKREPEHSARNNLKSLELCFAACRSAQTGRPVAPGAVRRLPH